GNDSSFYRLVRGEDTDEVFESDADFWSATKPPLDDGAEFTDMDYQTNYIGDVAGADNLPYLAVYSTPSWNTEIKSSPGFIALHDLTAYEEFAEQDGAYIDDFMIEVYTNEELRLPDGTTSSWFGTEGTMEVNIPSTAAENACEIIWCGGIYGYGRFKVGDIGEPVSISEWSIF
ncbi:MAG: hypothetical protein GY869_01115, partial [Planctomycetes bacterium]|nr:hypothetical protein [Planctomycetota bacterium]